MVYFDTHCHLESYIFDSNLLSTLQTQPNHQYLHVSTKASQWQAHIDAFSLVENVHVALGVHPWFATNEQLSLVNSYEILFNASQVKAVGEIGLDYSAAYLTHKAIQWDLFEAQLSIAARYDKPVSLHIIKAHNDALAMLKSFKVSGVVHGLGSSLETVQQYLDLGLKIGVNGVCLRDNARRYHALVRYAGLDNLVLETDFPNIILPTLVKSHLTDIVDIAQYISALLNVSVDEVVSRTYDNAKKIFLG